MGLATLNTILNTAPIIIQGATKLISLIKSRNQEEQPVQPEQLATLEDLKHEVLQINQRLDNTDDSNVEQIKLIGTLAKQNEALANSLRSSIKLLNVVSVIALIALAIGITCLVLIISN